MQSLSLSLVYLSFICKHSSLFKHLLPSLSLSQSAMVINGVFSYWYIPIIISKWRNNIRKLSLIHWIMNNIPHLLTQFHITNNVLAAQLTDSTLENWDISVQEILTKKNVKSWDKTWSFDDCLVDNGPDEALFFKYGSTKPYPLAVFSFRC